MWLIGAVVCLLAASLSCYSLMRTMDGRMMRCGIAGLCLCQQAAISEIAMRTSGRRCDLCNQRCTKCPSFPFYLLSSLSLSVSSLSAQDLKTEMNVAPACRPMSQRYDWISLILLLSWICHHQNSWKTTMTIAVDLHRRVCTLLYCHPSHFPLADPNTSNSACQSWLHNVSRYFKQLYVWVRVDTFSANGCRGWCWCVVASFRS